MIVIFDTKRGTNGQLLRTGHEILALLEVFAGILKSSCPTSHGPRNYSKGFPQICMYIFIHMYVYLYIGDPVKYFIFNLLFSDFENFKFRMIVHLVTFLTLALLVGPRVYFLFLAVDKISNLDVWSKFFDSAETVPCVSNGFC